MGASYIKKKKFFFTIWVRFSNSELIFCCFLFVFSLLESFEYFFGDFRSADVPSYNQINENKISKKRLLEVFFWNFGLEWLFELNSLDGGDNELFTQIRNWIYIQNGFERSFMTRFSVLKIAFYSILIIFIIKSKNKQTFTVIN